MHQNSYTPCPSAICPWDKEIVQHMQINKCISSQKIKLKSFDHFNTLIKNAFDKTHHFMIRTTNRLGMEGAYISIIKAIQEKPTFNIILLGKN